MRPVIYLNGQWVAPEDAKVSVMDRGFLFGDAVYEVVPVYSRYPFRLEAHLHRLAHSLAAIGWEITQSAHQRAARLHWLTTRV